MKKKSVFYSILTVSSLGVLAKILGLVREGVVAAYFGTSAQMDVFSMLSGYMTTFITIFAASASLSFVPIFVKHCLDRGTVEASKQLSNLLNQYVIVSSIFYFLLFIISPLLPQILDIKGVDADTIVLYARLLFFTIIFSGFSRIQLGALGGLRDFGWHQKTTALYSIISIVLTLLFGAKFGVGVLVASYIINSIVQLIILQIQLRKHDCRYSFYINFKDTEIKDIWKNTIPVFLGAEVYLLGLTIDRTIGLSLGVEGTASAFNYAGLLYGLVNTIISAPIVTVFYTELSKTYADVGVDGLYKRLSSTISNIALVLLPIALFLCVDSKEFVTCALRRGEFNNESVVITSSIFMGYILISPFYAFRALMARTFIILKDQRIPMYSGIMFITINIFMGIVLSKVLGIIGIVVSAFLAMSVSSFYLYFMLRANHAYHGKMMTTSIYKAIFSSALAGTMVFIIKRAIPDINIYIGFIIEGAVFVVAYVVFLRILKVPELIAIQKKVLSRVSNHGC